MPASLPDLFYKNIIERINTGIFVVTIDYTIVEWNHYMETHSGKSASSVIGENLFSVFPELPKAWLKRKLQSVFILNNYSFTSWEHRPYLFHFEHHRPITGDVEYMFQDCTFIPIKNEKNQVAYVCVSLADATDTAIYQRKLQTTLVSMEKLSNQDGLTGLINRRQLEKQIIVEISRASRYKLPLTFAMFDLDHFKKVNDTYGHLAGDEVLRHIALQALNTMRISDIVGRYGGEEFAVVLPGTKLNESICALERFRKNVEKTLISFEDKKIPVTISVGVSEFHEKIKSHTDLIHEADAALYYSKENGRNCITRFDEI